MQQRLGFVRALGSRVAYALMGDGPPMVFSPVGHLLVELENQALRSFFESLAGHFTLVRYDRLGTGMSDRVRNAETLTLEAEVAVLETLLDDLDLGPVHLFGFAYGGAVATALTASRPELVRRQLLFGSYARGDLKPPALVGALTAILRVDWELGSRLLAAALIPDADQELTDWFTRLRRESSDGEMAASALELWARTDVRDLLGRVSAPTLVLHRREDPVVPVELGRTLAALIPHARFELLEGRWHQPWLGDAATVLTLAGDFFGFIPPAPAEDRNRAPTLTPREREVLRLVAQGLNDAGIAERLVLSAHTVHRHVANIRHRLGQPSRAAAAAHAARNGLI
jgi:pimeloyl-ACP methyl ester carboxylesterase/DNA-binding CsgD family transcriptional regulator